MANTDSKYEVTLMILDDIKSGGFEAKVRHREIITANSLVELASKFILLLAKTAQDELEIEKLNSKGKSDDDIPF